MTEQINPLDVGVIGAQPKEKLRVIDSDGYFDAVDRGRGEANAKDIRMFTSYDCEHFSAGATKESYNTLNEFLAALPELREKYWVVTVLITRE
jgi:hypothetical protein